ncbi:MAG TPA: putative glycolipid-binding domain-containing protein [Thermoanaerobaculia bacterium]
MTTATSREILWRRRLDDLSFELARFTRTPRGVVLSGTVLIAEEGAPLRVEYRISCDAEWWTRTVAIEQTWRGARQVVTLAHDGRGRWLRDGGVAPELAGCIDVDLGVTPSTNALPVNRLRLPIGGRGELLAAWVHFPQVDVTAARQGYERLGEARYRYSNVGSDFAAVLEVDGDGLPIDYEGIWKRVAEGPAAPEG